MTKLGIVCPYDYFRHGGVQEHIRAVAEGMRQRGWEVKVLTPLPPDKINRDPANVITLGRSTKLNAPSTSFEVSVSATPSEIDDVLESEKFDIINYHEPAVPMLSSQILSRSSAINVATVHARMPDSLISKPFELLALQFGKSNSKNFDAITAVSEAAAYHVSKITNTPITFIPNGILLERFDPKTVDYYAPFHDSLKTILYIGRLERRKGVEYLLKAYRELSKRRDDCRLVIAGDGPRKSHLEELVGRYDLDNVSFLGFVSEEDKLTLLKTCDVFCSPAMYGESFGIVLLEAMAMGAPIVAGMNPGYISVLKETGMMSLVNSKDASDFSYRLELLLYDEATRALYKKWEKTYVKQFDYEIIVDSYQAFYQSLLV